MRTSKYRKKISLTKKQKKIAAGCAAVCLLGAIIFFFTYFHVENVEVMGSEHYTEDEIKEMILRGPMATNSILAPVLYTKDETDDVPLCGSVFRYQDGKRYDCRQHQGEESRGLYSLS